MLSGLKRLPLVGRLRGAVQHDVEQTLKPLRKELRQLTSHVEQLEAALRETSLRAARGDRESSQVKWTLQLNAQPELMTRLERVLDEPRIAAHVDAAIAAAPLLHDPIDHLVVDQLLPEDVYELLLDAIPPVVFFSDNDPVKQDLPIPMAFGPTFHLRAWGFVDEVLSRRIIIPAVMRRFHGELQLYYDTIFGDGMRERANALPQSTSGGRLMLRRPGYHLSPHRDPKRSLVTCLMYLAKPGDSEAHGTALYRVDDDREAHYKQTYYPEREGHRCTLARMVPFKANSMLAFVNSRGAHGAGIPADAPATIERYAYQFYIAPDNDALGALIRSLPKGRKEMWFNRNRVTFGEGDA